MNRKTIVILGIIGALVFIFTGSYISNHNYGVRAENNLEALYDNMENILGQYSLKVKEAAQVPDMKADDLEKVTREAMSGRYGDDGSKAVFNWIQENYPGQVTDPLYLQIHRIIEAGRNTFQNAQTKMIDARQVYKDALGYWWKGFWLRVAGFPKVDLDSFKVISSQHAKDVFGSGMGKVIELR